MFSYLLTIEGTGTYRVDGTSLFVELTTVSLYADSREVKEALVHGSGLKTDPRLLAADHANL